MYRTNSESVRCGGNYLYRRLSESVAGGTRPERLSDQNAVAGRERMFFVAERAIHEGSLEAYTLPQTAARGAGRAGRRRQSRGGASAASSEPVAYRADRRLDDRTSAARP